MQLTSLTHVNIIELLGVETLAVEKRVTLVTQAIDLVEARTLSRVLEVLPKEKQETFADLLAREDHGAVQELFLEHDVDYLRFIEEETEQTKRDLQAVLTAEPEASVVTESE